MPNNHRLLLISRNFPPLVGGMERLNHHVLQELEREYAVDLVGPEGAAAFVPHPERVRTCTATPLSRFLACASIEGVRLARRKRPQLIIAGSGVNAPPAWIAARASGARWMIYLHGLDLVVSNRIYQRVFVPVIRRADAWLVNSRSTAQLAVTAGLDPARMHILHPGVEIPEALPAEEAVQDWRRRHALGDRPLLLSVGRLTKRKGLREFVLNALPTVLASCPQTLFVVVGEEPHAALTSATVGVSAVREAARTNGTLSSLRVLGRLSDEELALAYRAASVLVFPVLDIPGDIEGFGMVAVEAAAYGLPTVAFAVGGVPDAVSDGASGFLVTPGDYDAMAERAIDLTSRSSGPSGAACIAHASRFAWADFGYKLRNLCEGLIAEPNASNGAGS